MTTTVTMPDADALRDHLDGLNEAGTTPISVGIDAPPELTLGCGEDCGTYGCTCLHRGETIGTPEESSSTP